MKKPLIAAIGLAAFAQLAVPQLAHAETLRTPHWVEFSGKESLDPISPTRFYSANQLIYSRLVRQGSKGEPVSDLASEWQANPAADEWTFTLRDGVSFHNGKALSADDVIYSFTRLLDPERDAPARAALSVIEDVSVNETGQIVFRLSQSHADLPILLMDYRAKIVPVGFDDDTSLQGIGTGPFKLVEFDPQGTTTFEAFADYWEGAPKLDGMDLIGIPDDNARTQALLAGQIDWSGWNGVNAQQLRLFSSNPAYHYDSIATGDWRGMVFRADDEVFQDVRVRRALRLVADREEMVNLLFGKGGATITCDNPVWNGDQYKLAQQCPQDLDTARSLLSDAGYADGLEIDVYTSGVDNYFRPMTELYQRQAAEAGIAVNVHNVPAADYWNTAWMKKPAFTAAWGQRPTDQVLNEIFQSEANWNESAYKNPEFDALLAKARATLDDEARTELYHQAQALLTETGATLIPFHLNNNRVMKREVHIPAVEHFAIRWHQVDKQGES